MKIQPELQPLIESRLKEDQKRQRTERREFIDECQRLGLSLEYFTKENITQVQVDMLAHLHRDCYPEYDLKGSFDYVNKSIAYNGFHAFLLSHEGKTVAATWFDDGKPYYQTAKEVAEYYSRWVGSNLVTYTVQVMTAPNYRGRGLSLGLNLIVKDFCNTAFNGPPLSMARVADANTASNKLHEKLWYGRAATGPARMGDQPTHLRTSPMLVPEAAPSSKEEQPPSEAWEITHFPNHPARHYLGRVATMYSTLPHTGLYNYIKEADPNPRNHLQDTLFKYRNDDSITEKADAQALDRQSFTRSLDKTLTFTDSVHRSTIEWKNCQIFIADVSMPRHFIGPDLAASLVFTSLYTMAKKELNRGNEMMIMKLHDVEVQTLSQIIDTSYPFRLTDFVEVGDHTLTADKEALKRGYRDYTTLYMKLGAVCAKLERLPWIANSYTLSTSTKSIYSFDEQM